MVRLARADRGDLENHCRTAEYRMISAPESARSHQSDTPVQSRLPIPVFSLALTVQPLTWSRAVNVTETLRVQAVESSYDVPLLTQSGQQQVQISSPTTPPAIVLNQADPVSGQVQLSVSNAGTYSSATYFVDLLTLSTSPGHSGFPGHLGHYPQHERPAFDRRTASGKS